MSEEIENLRKKADQLAQEGEWVELIQIVTKLINLEEEPHYQAMAYYHRGIAYFYKPNSGCAIADFKQAIKIDPKYVNAYYACGITYFLKKSDFGNAFSKFSEAIKEVPTLKFSDPTAYITSYIKVMNDLEEKQQIKAFEIYIKLLITVSEIKGKLFCKKESRAAHYTSLDALKNLSEIESRFRLYNADYMNDPEEGQVFFKIMNEYQIDIKKRIDIEEWFYQDKDKSYRSPAYIGSFVQLEAGNEQKDKLFLWRTYGKHDNEEAAGACLIFNNKKCFAEDMQYQLGLMAEMKLVNITGNDEIKDHNNLQKLELYKIHYRGKSDGELKKGLKILRDQLEIIRGFIEKVQGEETKSALQRLARELLDSIRFLFKDNHYSEENEVRVIQWNYGEKDESSESKIKVDVENIPPRFYVEAPENFRFSEVILGPRTERYQEWEQWLKTEAKKQEKNIDIKRSKIKYGKS